LNLIEILWRFIKYDWRTESAYRAEENFVLSVENMEKQIGSKFLINFAS